MGPLLLVNDDGVDSPALVPFARALRAQDALRVVVPDGERSWISKGVTRFRPVRLEAGTREDVELHTVDGTPADCTQLGVHGFPGPRPRCVVSGINVGYNHGLAFFLSSGTIGAASEGWIAGMPALAFSMGHLRSGRHETMEALHAASRGAWEAASEVAAEITRRVLASPWPVEVDLISVNMPLGVDADTPRRVTSLARVGYDALFERNDEGHFEHRFRGRFRDGAALEGTDVEAATNREVSITPVRLASDAALPEALRVEIERG